MSYSFANVALDVWFVPAKLFQMANHFIMLTRTKLLPFPYFLPPTSFFFFSFLSSCALDPYA
uniref:Retrovirus-related Pol polyprotein from transposon TNT 1-94 n=1 Tax=Rhizophora mucronata TaxID=61149 RepID=A0A2P2QLU6_RHIMU